MPARSTPSRPGCWRCSWDARRGWRRTSWGSTSATAPSCSSASAPTRAIRKACSSRTTARCPMPRRSPRPATRLVGTISQVPPATSAIKVGGRRAYALARAGRRSRCRAREVRRPRTRRRLLRRRERPRRARHPLLQGHLRPRAGARPRRGARLRRLLRGAAAAGDRASRRRDTRGRWTTSRRIRSPARGALRCSDALAHLPGARARAGRAHGAAARPRHRGARRGGPAPLPRRRAARVRRRAARRGAAPARGGGRGMRIVNGVEQLEPRRRVVVLGTFDGVHLGHRRLIQEALERARELGAITTVATFDPMPLRDAAPRPGSAPALRHRAPRRADRAGGRRRAARSSRSRTSSRCSRPRRSPSRCSSARAGAVHVVVGENYRFGHARRRRRGDADCARTAARLRRHRGRRS